MKVTGNSERLLQQIRSMQLHAVAGGPLSPAMYYTAAGIYLPSRMVLHDDVESKLDFRKMLCINDRLRLVKDEHSGVRAVAVRNLPAGHRIPYWDYQFLLVSDNRPSVASRRVMFSGDMHQL